ncbi:hypothetical protein IJH66_02625 [Candidatus Saccharibacteria bacterium]|nr:hypothetical protein [Candidatus Saccharibacteria bacterium]MBQ6605849.1 hypothetical protein [Candidatus Saccharibacteria bacterium]
MSELETVFKSEDLAEELRRESRSLGLPAGSAEDVIKKVTEGVCLWLEERNIITKSDLERVVSRELDKYNADLAYIYRNRDKII